MWGSRYQVLNSRYAEKTRDELTGSLSLEPFAILELIQLVMEGSSI